ncbi:GATOR complex protein WDR59 [Exaiptasia diaphana]|uniref:RWD domain-containing protein n=1 Tax=Exaiptasia diaphana TaxID=2652724 RepID=A0A913YCZ2_EXADI|nr:GATOR complex protein WDR59 [Exaiptasia diaphana]
MLRAPQEAHNKNPKEEVVSGHLHKTKITKMAAFKDSFFPHTDWPATVFSVDCTGSHAVLGARKGLAFINLENPSVIAKKVTRNSKWECGTTEWNPHISHKHTLVSVSNQKAEIWRWRDGSGTQQQILRAHTRAISDVNWSWYDPQLLSTCSVDQFVYIWDLRDGKKPATSLQTVVGASQVKWNREDRHVLATSHDGDIRVWDLRKGNAPVVYITAHLSKVHGIDWSYNSSMALATCSNDSTVKLWNTQNPQQPEAKLNASYPVWRARYTPFGHGLVTVVVPQLRRGEHSLCLWNTANMTSTVPPPVHTFDGHTDVVLDFHWRSQSVDGEDQFQLISWSKDNCLRMWSLEPRIISACSENPQSDHTEMSSSVEVLSTGSPSYGSFEIMSEKRSSIPQTIQQEFALINVNIPNVTVEQMDASQRCCTVSVTSGPHVTLSIHFPAMYPNNAIPSFEFTPDTALSLSTKTKLIKTLRETAQSHVKLNQTCLEPCLRQLVSHVEGLTLLRLEMIFPENNSICRGIVRTSIQDFAFKFKGSSIDIYFSRFLLLYIVFHFIPLKLLLPKSFRSKEPWMIYSQHGFHSEISSHSEDCLVFDPDKIHDSSSSLSTFLARYEKEGWTPPAPKLKKTAWTWTSDEEKESNRLALSIPDIGYITKSKTCCSSSETESEQQVPRPRRVRKRKTNKEVEKKEEKLLMVSVGCMTDKIKSPLHNIEKRNEIDVNKASDRKRANSHVNKASSSLRSLKKGSFKERLSFDLANISFKEKKKEKKLDESGITGTKAVKYGLVAMGVGLGGYLIYKACTRN